MAKPLILQKNVKSTNVFIRAPSTEENFSGLFETLELTKISLSSREWEWELTFFREWDRDRDSRKCLV
jgi:hypothetical protein